VVEYFGVGAEAEPAVLFAADAVDAAVGVEGQRVVLAGRDVLPLAVLPKATTNQNRVAHTAAILNRTLKPADSSGWKRVLWSSRPSWL